MPASPAAAYQRPVVGSATPRTESNFDNEIGRIARSLIFSVPNLTDYERGLLGEFGRGASRDGEVRYRLLTFKALIAIARRSRRIEDRKALPELIEAEIEADAPAMDIGAAFDLETPAPGAADVAQRAFEQNPDPITWQRCRDALWKQLTSTLAAYRAVCAWGLRHITSS